MTASFLTGPVSVKPEVLAAFAAPPISHRDPAFLEIMNRTRANLKSLVNGSHVTLMMGSGTLANDAVAAQIRGLGRPGLVLANGEFGERLLDHARRWHLDFAVERKPWGEAFDWTGLRQSVDRFQPKWIWAVLTETSTGVANALPELRALSAQVGADLCLDAVSAIGLDSVDLRGVRFATAVSGKGLAAFPGLAAVFHDGRLAGADGMPRYLDLASYESADGVPFTHSSNLVAALDRSLTLNSWARKFASVRERSRNLRAALRHLSLPPLASDEDAAAGIITVPLPEGTRSADVARALAGDGLELAWQSRYLLSRNWLQIALMGEIDEPALGRLPFALAAQVAVSRGASAPPPPRYPGPGNQPRPLP